MAKLSTSGAHAWSTYMGGSDYDYGHGIAVDGFGSVYVTGVTASSGWASGGFDTSHNGGEDIFVAMMSTSGGHAWSTYMGGSGRDRGYGIAVDGSGGVYVTGGTASGGWVSGGFDTSYNGGEDIFVARIDVGNGVDLSPLWLDASGGFTYNPSTQRYEASGLVEIGLTDGSSSSPALLSVNGTVWYNDTIVHADGVVSAQIGGLTAPLFDGVFEFNVGQALTSTLNDAFNGLETEYNLGGAELKLDRIELVDPTGGSPSDARLEIEAAIKMPAELGGATIAITGSNEIIIDASGVAVTGAAITFPDIVFTLGGLFPMKATGLAIEYVSSPESLKLQGAVEVKAFPTVGGIGADFAGDNYILLSESGVEVVGKLWVTDVTIVPGVWEIKSAELTIDTTQNEVRADATVLMPTGIVVEGGLGFVGGSLNYIRLGVGQFPSPGVAIGTTGVFLQSIGGQIDHIADADPVTFGGNVGATAGPQITINMPWWWPGDDFAGSLLRLDVNGEIDRYHLSASGNLSFVNGLATMGIETELNWHEGFLTVDGTMNVLDGFILADTNFRADSGLNINMSGGAAARIPDSIPILGGITLASGRYIVEFTNDSDYSNDFVMGWGEIPLLGTKGLIVRFNGDWAVLGGAEINQMIPSASTVAFLGAAASDATPATAWYDIAGGTNWVTFSAEWDNASPGTAIELFTPSGAVLTEADIAATPDISIIDALTTDYRKVVLVDQPEAGAWGISVPDATGLGQVDFYAMVGTVTPTVNITHVSGGLLRQPVQIDLEAYDADSDATVSLYYDTDDQGFDGVLIAGGLAEVDGQLSHEWNPTTVPPGDYYVYAMIVDGENPAEFAYAANPVTITSPTFIEARHIFYNNSAWDGSDPLPNASDDGAIATDKQALLPGGTASFANYTNYGRGINGIMIDIENLAGTPSASDFLFKVGNNDDPSTWTTLAAPVTVSVRPGEGENASDRVTILFPDNAVENQWLKVTVLATADTGLAAEDVFQFGNLVGDFSGSGQVEAVDIDTLYGAIEAGSDDPQYDLNGDYVVDKPDVTELVEGVLGTRYGDVTLDQAVNGADLSLMAVNWLATEGMGWADGDLTGDGAVNGADLSLMAANWLWQAPEATSAAADPVEQALASPVDGEAAGAASVAGGQDEEGAEAVAVVASETADSIAAVTSVEDIASATSVKDVVSADSVQDVAASSLVVTSGDLESAMLNSPDTDFSIELEAPGSASKVEDETVLSVAWANPAIDTLDAGDDILASESILSPVGETLLSEEYEPSLLEIDSILTNLEALAVIELDPLPVS